VSAMPRAVDADEPEDFATRLRNAGQGRYHHRHPFNLLMHAGRLSAEDLRLWVANRYYYQTRIPIKDALILSKAEDPGFRRVWLQRLIDHDGPPCSPDRGEASPSSSDGAGEASAGGLELWRRLGRALDLGPEALERGSELLPAVRAACDDYVELVRGSDLLTAVAASLTEYFAGGLMQARIEAWQRHYPFVAAEALAYFRERVTRAPVDADFALAYVIEHAKSEAQIRRCLDAFEQKCRILWQLLDAVYVARRLGHKPRLERRVSLVARSQPGPEQAEQAGVLLVPEQALQLNRTALELLTQCNGGATLGEIVLRLAQEHALPLERVQMDIASFVGELERRRVLAFSA
jgi:pyrroloquinoline-quinone synthase